LHTNDAPSSITRLLDLGIPHFLITTTLIGILAQRLVREICPHCTEEYEPTGEEAVLLKMDPEKLKSYRFKRGRGCLHCRQTGFSGRIGVFEVLPMSEKLRRLVSHQAASIDIYKTAREEGMRTLREAAIEKVFRGITTTTEMARVTGK
jgi:general secretion pathway protein E